MTATLAEILDAMADQIRAVVDDVTDVAVQVEPRWVANPTPPTIDMWPGDPSDEPTIRPFGRALGAEVIMVRARTDMSDTEAGQDLLLALMDEVDPLSLMQALYEERTLGGLAGDLDIRNRSGYLPDFIGDSLLTVTWEVVVIKADS